MGWFSSDKKKAEKVITGIISGKSSEGEELDETDDSRISFFVTPDASSGVEEGIILTYEDEYGETSGTKIRALNNALKVGDKIRFVKYDNGEYSYPLKLG